MRIATNRSTFIYGLVDPRNQQVRYVGKTVLEPSRRASVHKCRARKEPHKLHSMAWLLNLARDGLEPRVIIVEEVPPGGDWAEAEQYWIAYFKTLGCNLCNHTAGGEGTTGYKQPPEMIAKRIRRGPEHHSFGKPQHPNARAALTEANERFLKDAGAVALRRERQKATLNSEFHRERMRKQNARLYADPTYKASLQAKIARAGRTVEARARVAAQSATLWNTKRDEIVAAQNAGKGGEWRKKHAALGRERLKAADHPLRKAALARRKLTDDDVTSIRRRILDGEGVTALAREYGVSQPHISHIKSGRSRS